MAKQRSLWAIYALAVAVTTVIGLLAFTVFVLSHVFGSSPASKAGDGPATAVSPSATPRTPAPPKSRPAAVLQVRAAETNPRVVVLVVSSPTGCARKLRTTGIGEGPGSVALWVTQQTYRAGCTTRPKVVTFAARAALGDRAIIVNGVPWTLGTSGLYQRAA